MRRLREAPEAQRRIAGLVVVAVELRRVAIGHSLGEAEGVALRRRRLGDELVPVVGIGREDAPVAHDERHPRWMEVILEELERPAQVALPAVGVPGKDQVEGARLGLGEHLVHRRRAPDRGAALGDLEHEAGVDEAVALDEAVLLLALAGRAIAVVLAGRRLADPAGGAQAADLVEGARQALHARGCPSFEVCHPGHVCSAVKSLPPQLIGAVGVAAVERLDIAGEGGDERVALHGRPRLLAHAASVPGLKRVGDRHPGRRRLDARTTARTTRTTRGPAHTPIPTRQANNHVNRTASMQL